MVPEEIVQCWSMDFKRYGRTFRLFNVIDDFNREWLTIDVDFSLPAERVFHALDRVIEWRGKPAILRCDNGPKYISKMLELWAEKRDIHLDLSSR